MDAAAFEHGAFQDFHAYFAPLFGRRETRDHSRHYLQALLVQSGERRNAENLSETVPASARVKPNPQTTQSSAAFKSTWDPGLDTLRVVWVLDGSDFPKQGRNRWEWPVSTAGDWAGQLPGRNVPGLCQPVGARCRRAGPRTKTGVRRQGFRRRGRAALEMLQREGLRDVAVLP